MANLNKSTNQAQAWPFPNGPVAVDQQSVVDRLQAKLKVVNDQITAIAVAQKGATHGPAKRPLSLAAKRARNHRAAWDAAADNQLILGYLAGQTPAALAKTCGRTKAAVAGRLHALGMLIFDKDTLTYSTAPKVWFKVPTV